MNEHERVWRKTGLLDTHKKGFTQQSSIISMWEIYTHCRRGSPRLGAAERALGGRRESAHTVCVSSVYFQDTEVQPLAGLTSVRQKGGGVGASSHAACCKGNPWSMAPGKDARTPTAAAVSEAHLASCTRGRRRPRPRLHHLLLTLCPPALGQLAAPGHAT